MSFDTRGKRLCFLVFGIMMLVPFDLIPWAGVINLIGLIGGALLYVSEWKVALSSKIGGSS